jgi:hypothetical protein
MRRARMFSLLSRLKSSTSTDLVKSCLYDEKSFYKAFLRDIRHARSEILIESPYMTSKRANEIAPICKKLVKRGVKVKVFTRNPSHHDEYLRIQSCIAIKRLKGVGVKVNICNDMRHRKIAVIDREVLWEGSLNMLSQNDSREIMRRTVSQQLSWQMIKFTGINRWSWW